MVSDPVRPYDGTGSYKPVPAPLLDCESDYAGIPAVSARPQGGKVTECVEAVPHKVWFLIVKAGSRAQHLQIDTGA